MSQDCVEARQELEERLARIQLAYEEAQAALAQCQMGGVSNPPPPRPWGLWRRCWAWHTWVGCTGGGTSDRTVQTTRLIGE